MCEHCVSEGVHGSNYLKLTATTACSPMILAPSFIHCGMW